MGTKYASIAISGYNAAPPADDGSTTEANRTTWAKHKTKLGDPIKTLVEAINTALVTHSDESAFDKAVTYTTQAADHKRLINVTAGVTISLIDASTAGASYIVSVKNSHSAAITVDLATGGDTLDGSAGGSISLPVAACVTFVTNEAADGYYLVAEYDRSEVDILKLAESSDHSIAVAAGKGLFWVKDDAPNSAMFTDDAGTDYLVAGSARAIAREGTVVVKQSSEAVNASTTLQDDDELTVTLAANSIYEFTAWLEVTATNATPDFKYRWVEPDGTFTMISSKRTNEGDANSDTYEDETSTVTTTYSVGTSDPLIAGFHGTIRTGGSGGAFKLQWAQNVSHASNTTVLAGSWMRVQKID